MEGGWYSAISTRSINQSHTPYGASGSQEEPGGKRIRGSLDAPKAKVWEALTDPAKVKQYMHGTNLTTDWEAGSPIAWEGEWNGQPYVDKGTVLEIEPEKLLKYTHWSPMGGSADTPENYHVVTCELAEKSGKTTLTLTQDNNATQAEADKMAEANWGPMLQGLKATAEK